MITLEELARQKQSINVDQSQRNEGLDYDHASQQTRVKLDRESFRISMKSDTKFDGEADPTDEH